VVDARQKTVSRGRKYFFLFEDETGLLEGMGETKCLTFGSPPACYLRGEMRQIVREERRFSTAPFSRLFKNIPEASFEI